MSDMSKAIRLIPLLVVCLAWAELSSAKDATSPKVDFDQGPDAGAILLEVREGIAPTQELAGESVTPPRVRKIQVPMARADKIVSTALQLGVRWPPSDNPQQPCIDMPPSADDPGGTIISACKTPSVQRLQTESKAEGGVPDPVAPAYVLGPFASLVTENQDYNNGLPVKQQVDSACNVGLRAIPALQCETLGKGWLNIESVRVDLAAQGKNLDFYDDNLDANARRLNPWYQRLDARYDALDILRKKLDAGCNPCYTDEECGACNRFSSSYNVCVGAHNASWDRYAPEVDKWRAAYNCLKPKGNDFRGKVAAWIKQISDWIFDAKTALGGENFCIVTHITPPVENNGRWSVHCSYKCTLYPNQLCGIPGAWDHSPTFGEIELRCPDQSQVPPVSCPPPW